MTKQYEWRFETFSVGEVEELQGYLNKKYSEEGYKLHSVVSNESLGNYITLVFEREKEQDSDRDESDYADDQYEAHRDALFEARHESLWSEGD